MYYLRCKVIEIQHSYVIVEANNVAYRVNLSNSFSLVEGEEALIYIFQEFKLDMKNQISSHLYGFLSKQEIEIFLFLISVKGIGCKTAQIILSNDLYKLADLITKRDSLSISRLKGLNWMLASSLLFGVSQSKNIRNIFISLTKEKSDKEIKNGISDSWDEDEVINSLIEIGYEWDSIKKALDEIKGGKWTFPDNNAVINKCLQTIVKNQAT